MTLTIPLWYAATSIPSLLAIGWATHALSARRTTRPVVDLAPVAAPVVAKTAPWPRPLSPRLFDRLNDDTTPWRPSPIAMDPACRPLNGNKEAIFADLVASEAWTSEIPKVVDKPADPSWLTWGIGDRLLLATAVPALDLLARMTRRRPAAPAPTPGRHRATAPMPSPGWTIHTGELNTFVATATAAEHADRDRAFSHGLATVLATAARIGSTR